MTVGDGGIALPCIAGGHSHRPASGDWGAVHFTDSLVLVLVMLAALWGAVMGLFSYAVLRLAKSVTGDSQHRRERLRTMPGASRTTAHTASPEAASPGALISIPWSLHVHTHPFCRRFR